MYDKGVVVVRFFREGIEFGNSIIKSLFGEVVSMVGGVEDFVVENGEVES